MLLCQVFSQLNVDTRESVLSFMDVRDLANMMQVNNTARCLILQETRPIAILAVIPTTVSVSGVVREYRHVRYFVPHRTLISTLIVVIKQDFPHVNDSEFIFTDREWTPLNRPRPLVVAAAWPVRHQPAVFVSELPAHILLVQYIRPSVWGQRRATETRLAWRFRLDDSRVARQARQARFRRTREAIRACNHTETIIFPWIIPGQTLAGPDGGLIEVDAAAALAVLSPTRMSIGTGYWYLQWPRDLNPVAVTATRTEMACERGDIGIGFCVCGRHEDHDPSGTLGTVDDVNYGSNAWRCGGHM